jgi:hypothetical protein
VSDKKEHINLKKSFFKKSLQKIKLKKNKLNEYIRTFHFYLKDFTKDCKGECIDYFWWFIEKMKERDEVRKEFEQKTNTYKTIQEILKNKFQIHFNLFNYIGKVLFQYLNLFQQSCSFLTKILKLSLLKKWNMQFRIWTLKLVTFSIY